MNAWAPQYVQCNTKCAGDIIHGWGSDYIFSNIIVHSRICESYNLKQSYVEFIRKRLGSECTEGSWAIVQSGVTLENHRLLCPLVDIYTTYYIFLQKKKDRIFSVQCEIHITGARYPSFSLDRIEIVEKLFY